MLNSSHAQRSSALFNTSQAARQGSSSSTAHNSNGNGNGNTGGGGGAPYGGVAGQANGPYGPGSGAGARERQQVPRQASHSHSPPPQQRPYHHPQHQQPNAGGGGGPRAGSASLSHSSAGASSSAGLAAHSSTTTATASPAPPTSAPAPASTSAAVVAPPVTKTAADDFDSRFSRFTHSVLDRALDAAARGLELEQVPDIPAPYSSLVSNNDNGKGGSSAMAIDNTEDEAEKAVYEEYVAEIKAQRQKATDARDAAVSRLHADVTSELSALLATLVQREADKAVERALARRPHLLQPPPPPAPASAPAPAPSSRPQSAAGPSSNAEQQQVNADNRAQSELAPLSAQLATLERKQGETSDRLAQRSDELLVLQSNFAQLQTGARADLTTFRAQVTELAKAVANLGDRLANIQGAHEQEQKSLQAAAKSFTDRITQLELASSKLSSSAPSASQQPQQQQTVSSPRVPQQPAVKRDDMSDVESDNLPAPPSDFVEHTKQRLENFSVAIQEMWKLVGSKTGRDELDILKADVASLYDHTNRLRANVEFMWRRSGTPAPGAPGSSTDAAPTTNSTSDAFPFPL